MKPYFTIGNFDIDMMTLIDHCKKLMSNNEVANMSDYRFGYSNIVFK